MKIKILRSAKNDLLESYYFYELQQEGVGEYFLESLSADIESLKIYLLGLRRHRPRIPLRSIRATTDY